MRSFLDCLPALPSGTRRPTILLAATSVAFRGSEGSSIMSNSFGSQAVLTVGERRYAIHRLAAVFKRFPNAARLPYSLRVLLENLLRTENGLSVRPDDIAALASWDAK